MIGPPPRGRTRRRFFASMLAKVGGAESWLTGNDAGGWIDEVQPTHGLVVASLKGHAKAMGHAKISELKNRLSYYLSRVRRGESILVLDRDRVVARIDPAGEGAAIGADDDARWLDELERKGILRRSHKPLPSNWLANRPVMKANVVDALLRERDEGR